jgi:thymidylate synthase
MRSNDAVYGYKNDYAWQRYVQKEVLQGVNSKSGTVYGLGDLHWNAGSLHVYERHFELVNDWATNGDFIIV